MKKPWSLWGKFKPILDFFSLQERLVSLGENTASGYTFFSQTLCNSSTAIHLWVSTKIHATFSVVKTLRKTHWSESLALGGDRESDDLLLLRGRGLGSWLIFLKLNQKHREKTLLLKWKIQKEKDPVKSRTPASGIHLLKPLAWQVCQGQTESRWNWNQSLLPLTATFTAFQLSHQSVRHNASPCLGI